MASGPEHYAEAEKLLKETERFYDGRHGQTRAIDPPSASDVARAQVHATLALAAATVDVAVNWSNRESLMTEWGEATS